MGKSLTFQRLLVLQRKIWNFKINEDHEDNEYIAREQLKSFAQLSQIGSIISPPCLIYMLVKLFLNVDITVFVGACVLLIIPSIIAARNFIQFSKADFDTVDFKQSAKMIEREAFLNALGFGSVLALPIALGQLAFTPDLAILALGSLILGGFIYGSIPRAQTYYGAVTTLVYSLGIIAAGGVGAIAIVGLIAFFSLALHYIYRMFFFNFAQRHMQTEKLKENSETVRLLLNDYSEQSSDWLWETDSAMKIRDPASRFALASKCEVAELDGRPLVSLFADSSERTQLIQAMDKGEPFRDLIVPINLDNEQRWWRLSGRKTSSNDNRDIAFRGVAADVTNAKLAEDRVAHLAHFDSLTDLPNRALFNESLQRSVQRRRKDQLMAVLYIDLDHFKLVNDTLGHGAGDVMLKAIADRLESAIGIEDVVARLGGDEFAVSLRNMESIDVASEMAQKIIDKLSEPVLIDGQPVSSGASVGIALCPEHGESAEQLLRHADIALYQSKNKGRGCANMFTPDMREKVEDRRDIELDLRSAIIDGQMALHYQPLVNIETQETVAYEALLRWQHPEKGNIPPDQFIPIAEESGIIVQLGEWVIRTALDEIRNWPEHLSVSVNLSPAQMRSSNLLPTIVNALAQTGVEPNRLELEITESVLMSDNHSNIDLLHKIHSIGVRIALDDFGTGYSSLNYLRSFPFDKIKIDRCFVEDVDSREDCRAIIRAVTGLASSLGMVTTAEGVERDDQLQQLRSEGCEQVQGYLFSKAVPANLVEGRSKLADKPDAETHQIKPAKNAPENPNEKKRSGRNAA